MSNKTSFYNNPSINLVNPDNWDAAKRLESGLVRKLADTLGLDEVTIERPADPSHGDFSTNIAMQKAKELDKNPRELAEEYLSKINSDGLFESYLDKAEIAGPGFINFYLKKSAILGELEEMNRSEGKALPILLGKKIMFEYAHPNPFKSFHIGHLRNIILGESIIRIIEAVGAEVIRVNYQGDVGMHIAKTIWAMKKRMQNSEFRIENYEDTSSYEKAKLLGEMYAEGATAFEEDETAQNEIKNINFAIYTIQQNKFLENHPDWQPMKKYSDFLDDTAVNLEQIEELYELGKSWSLEEFHRLYVRLGSTFEREYMESETLHLSDLNVKEAKEKGILKESEGALIFEGEEFGLETRVFLNSLALPTYEGKELGLAELQFNDYPNLDLNIHNVAVEQKSFFAVTFKVQELLNSEKFGGKQYHNAYEFVGLKSGKMSSRKGKVVLAEDILNEAKDKLREMTKDKNELDEETLEKIALAAVKYSFLNISPFKYLAFDIEESLNFEGDSGVYILYTFSRGKKLIRDYQSPLPEGGSNFEALKTDFEKKLMKQLTLFESVIIDSGKGLAPHLLTNYLFNLAQLFNQFYKNLPILNEKDEELREARLILTNLAMKVLQRGLYLLGIETVEYM